MSFKYIDILSPYGYYNTEKKKAKSARVFIYAKGTKEQLYRICHISKSTVRYLLQSGKIPCYYTGKQTRCYKIKKEDVIACLENRKVLPEAYAAPKGWYKGCYEIKMEIHLPPEDLEELHYGNVDPQARGYRKGSHNLKVSKSINELKEKPTERLGGEDKALFLDFCNAYSGRMGDAGLDSFLVGFRFGAKMIFDSFRSDDAPFEWLKIYLS